MTATARGFEFGRLIWLAALSVWVTMVASLRLDAGEPVARWVADDWSGGTANWVDRVGGKIATSYGSPVKATTQFGGSASSSGIVFDGVDDYFEVASDQNPIAGQNRVTIVALFKTTQGATGTDGSHWQYPGPINAEAGGEPNDFGLSISQDGYANAFFNGAISPSLPVSVVDGAVHTMMLTWSDASGGGDMTARFYVDGVLKGSLISDNGDGIVASRFRFGRDMEDQRWFRGTVGELRFYASIEDPAALHASMSNVVPTLGFLSTTEAAGGDVVRISDSNIHTFRQSGSFVPSTSGTVEVLVVGGGGGGGGSFAGGGGGGGGVVSSTSYAVNAGEQISVLVGLGGAGGIHFIQGENGGVSQFGSLTALGGGGGGTYPGIGSGWDGGSGGGAGYAGDPGAGVLGQGFSGGAFGSIPEFPFNHGGGGGGGGGTPDSSGVGGVGVVSSISGLASYYVGGGAAGTDDSEPLAGGLGGGGAGGQGYADGLSGVANTGGGGGGGGGLSMDPVGGNGGSGVVIVRYTSNTIDYVDTAATDTFASVSGNLDGADVDPGTTLTYGISGATAINGIATTTGTYGTLTVSTTTGAYTFTPNDAAINALSTSTTETFVVTVSDGMETATANLVVNVTGVNDAPTITAISNQTTLEDTATGAIAFTVGDVETAVDSLMVTATSSNVGVVAAGGITLGGSGASRTITLSPVANASGTSTITVTVTDAGGASATSSFVLTVSDVNDAPTLVTPAFFTDFTSLPDNVTLGGAAQLQNGEAVLTEAVNSQYGTLTIAPLNPNPEAFVAEFSYRAYGGTGADGVSFNYGLLSDSLAGDPYLEYGRTDSGLVVSFIEYNYYGSRIEAKVDGVVLSTAYFELMYPEYRIVRVVVDGNGSLSVSVGGQSVLASVDLGSAYRSANKSAWRFGFGARTGALNNRHSLDSLTILTSGSVLTGGSEDTAFTISYATLAAAANAADVDGDSLSFRIEAVSSGTLMKGGVAVTAGTTLLSSGTESLVWTPASNANGTLNAFTVKAWDGQLASASAVQVSVEISAVNDAPSLDAITNPEAILEDAGAQTVNLTGIAAGGGETQGLTVTATSSNTGLIPNPTVTYASAATTGSLSYTPVANANGTAVITVTVTDNGGTDNSGVATTTQTFTVAVTAVNDAPTVSAISGQTTAEDMATSAIAFTVGDVETAVGSLTVTATSSNVGVVAAGGITLGGSGANRTITLTPVANATGTSTITVTVTDGGGASTTGSFTLTVTAVNDAPVVNASQGQTQASEQVAVVVDSGITVSDADNTTLASATVTVSGGYRSGEDVLGYVSNSQAHGNITGGFAASTGVLTLTSVGATATLAQWQEALRSVTYLNTSDAPNTLARTVTVVVNDGELASAAVTKTVSLTAVPDVVSVEGLTAASKVYDGTRVASVTGTPLLVGVPAGADVRLQGTPVFTLAQAAVGTAVTIQVSGLTLEGAQAADYTLVLPQLVGDITPKPISINGLSGVTKVYDGTTAATVSGTATLSGVGSDDVGQVILSGTPVFTFASANVGTGIAITTAGYTVSGSAAANYTLTQPSGFTGTITAKALSIGAPTIASKVYDGTTAAGAVTVGELSGLISPETLTVTGTAAAYGSAAVGTYSRVVTYTLANGGSGNTAGLAANYSLAAGSASGTITSRALTVTSAVVTSKAYDGTMSATITGTLTGVLSGDEVTLVGTGTFASKNVGANQVVTATSTLSGAAAGNYALTQPSGLTGTITAKALSIGAPTLASKVYDGTTVAGAVTVGALSGTVSPETLTVSGTADAYSSAAVGTYSGVAVTYTLANGGSGNTAGLAANYSLAAGSASGTITGRALTVTSPVVTSKAYDGTTVATITGTLSGVLNSDTVTLVGTGTFASKNVGANQVVTATSTLSGAAAGNYALTQPIGLTGTITAKALSIGAPTIASKVYDGTTVAGAVTVGALSGLVSPETLSVSGTVAAYSSAAVGTYQNVAVTYTLANGSGNTAGLASNYSLVAGSATGTITPRELIITVDPVSLMSDFDGQSHGVVWTTTPAGISVEVLYNGSTTLPKAAGSYSVTLSSADPNYSTRLEVTLVIRKSVQGITLNSAVVAAGLQTVSDASGRYLLQATLGQPIAGPASAVSGMQLNSGFWFTEQFSAALDGRNLVGAKLESKIRSSVILRGASIDAPEATVMGPEISRPALGVPPSTRLTVLPVAGSGEVWIRISGVPSGRWLIQYQNRLHSDQWLDEGLVELDGDGLGAVRAATGVGEMRFYRLVQQ